MGDAFDLQERFDGSQQGFLKLKGYWRNSQWHPITGLTRLHLKEGAARCTLGAHQPLLSEVRSFNFNVLKRLGILTSRNLDFLAGS